MSCHSPFSATGPYLPIFQPVNTKPDSKFNMAPRTKKAAATSSSAMAEGGVEIAPNIAQFFEAEERAQRALIGYARTDILDRQITFGHWNRRPENPLEVKKLLDSFLRNGVYRYIVAHAVPLIVQRDRLTEGGWISAYDDNLDLKDPSSIPTLRLVNDPKPVTNLPINLSDAPSISAAGGRHRTSALKQYHNIRCSMKVQYKKKVSEWKAAIQGEPENEEYTRCLDRDSRILKMVSNDVDLKGDWLVAIYDEGEWFQKILRWR